MTAMDRYSILMETPRGATYILNAILDEYGVIDLLNAVFPGMPEDEQQRFVDLACYRMFADDSRRVRVSDVMEYKGVKKTLRQHCVDAKLPENTVVKRLWHGWSIEKALETPIKHATIQPGTCGY